METTDRLFLLFLLCVVLPGLSQDVATDSSWIWYPESVVTEGARQTRFLRRTVQLDQSALWAQIRVRSDDSHSFFVNGEKQAETVESGAGGQVYDIAKTLKPGGNVLAFHVYNAGGMGGLIVTGLVREKGGTEHAIHSDPSFRAAKEEKEGWSRPGFDDSGWPHAIVVGSAFAAPWYLHASFDMDPFIGARDRERWEAWIKPILTPPASLRTEHHARARFEAREGHCVLLIDDAPRPAFLYRGTVDPLSSHGRRQIALFRDAGVHVYTAYLPLAPMWPRRGTYDFTHLDNVVRGYLSADNDAHIVLILRLIPPNWWVDEYPDEMVRYAAGDDFNTTDECGRVRRASLASTLWRRDMLALWRAAIEHLEEQPWGKRVIGYQPGYGIYTEWHYFGSWHQQGPDTGVAMTHHFRRWLDERYGSDEALRKAWSNPAASLATAKVPGMPPRLAAGALGLRDAKDRRWVIDYYRCQQEITADDIEIFCAAAKEATGERVVCGAFYGYFYGVHPQTQGGHLALERLLKSPAIDYFAAPYDYSHRLMGDDGRGRAIADAFRAAGKIHMIEADTRTSLHPRDEHGRLADIEQSVAAIRREVATALVHGNALWWCDFGASGGGGWYDHPALIGEVKELVALAQRRLERPTRKTAEVALLCDLESCYELADGAAMGTHRELVSAVTGELYRTGTPFKTLLVSQASEETLQDCKVIVVLNALRLAPGLRQRLRRLAATRSILWLWAPGFTNGAAYGPDLVKEATGFGVSLQGGGFPVASVECATEHPLTAHVPSSTATDLTPRQTVPIPELLNAGNWYNPRSEKVMREQYREFEWRVENGLRWDFATSASWTDIHLTAAVPSCDGIAIDISGEGVVDGAALRVVLKSAVKGEFVSPTITVRNSRTHKVLPLATFSKAPWDRTDASKLAFPLRGMKLVLRGTGGQRHGVLRVHGLAGVNGDVRSRQVRVYGQGRATVPCLLVDDPEATALGRDPLSGNVVLACKGSPGARQLLSTVPYIPRQVLSALFKEAGVHRYTASPDVIVRADSKLVSLHTATGGDIELCLPASHRVRDALTGEEKGTGSRLKLQLPPNSTTLLSLE